MLLAFLTIAASLSPLLTFAKLFQLKEWRLDRLREHLRSEGWFRSLLGKVRPIMVIGGSLLQLSGVSFPFSLELGAERQMPALYILGTLTFLNVVQILLRKQPNPVWTKKAIALVGTSLLLTTIASYWLLVIGYWLPLVLVPLLQPVFLLTSWLLWKPIDLLLKRRILHRAKALRAQFPNLTVIGITGSAGKTTTKELLAHILGPTAIATPEHVNTELGVAKWLIEILSNQKKLSERVGLVGPTRGGHDRGKEEPTRGKPLGCSLVIVEMGAYHQGEVALLCSVTQPTMGIITNIGTQHIGLFGSKRAIAEAKGELFASLPPSGHAFLNIESAFAQELRQKCVCPVTTVGMGNAADLQATHVEETLEGLRFLLHTTLFTVPIHSEHQLPNVLLAVAAAEALGMTLEQIANRLLTFHPPAHTFALHEEHDIHILDDTHNASPESLRAAIAWAKHQPFSPKILVTPGIIEQGSATARLHVHCGTLAKDVFDEVFVLNKKLAQYFEQGFGKPVHYNLKAGPRLRGSGSRRSCKLEAGTLLVCVGRVSQSIIQKILP